ncbi:MAG: methyltransferase domain-containing protein [Alphaproteobacteria bacterium]|nr:methyltransferase domain-containing protein [Alphaproteobacteria bacterium]
MNNNALNFFSKLASNSNLNAQSVKLAKNTDLTEIDADFILKYASSKATILDLGTGTGLIVNKIYNYVKSIDCVELFECFSKFILVDKKIKIINQNIWDFTSEKKYDMITMFGFMHYFNEEEAIKVYQKCYNFIKNNGKVIIKNQFGVQEDVTVAGYSSEQQTDYFAQYRYIDKEVNILKNIGFKNIEVIDIYPPEANRWHNTHFYAIVADK